MYQGLVRVLLVLILGVTAVLGLGLLVGLLMVRPPGPGIAIIAGIGACYASPVLALGSLVLAALALAGRDKLGAGERIAAVVVAACGLMPLAVPILIFMHANS